MATDRASLIIRKVVDKLSQFDGVAALVLTGSQVKGNKFPPDQFSDIELYVVAFDKNFEQVENEVQGIQKIFEGDEVILAYKNQWAGWSVLFSDLLRLELPLVKASDETVFARSEEQKIEILHLKPDFILKKGSKEKIKNSDSPEKMLEQAIKDFWYMAAYAAQRIGRGEVWLARDAIRISMQGKVKRLLQEIYHKDTLALDRDRKIELTWSKEELGILKETSSTYDRDNIVRAFWENIKHAEGLLLKMGMGEGLFDEYKSKLIPSIKKILREAS